MLPKIPDRASWAVSARDKTTKAWMFAIRKGSPQERGRFKSGGFITSRMRLEDGESLRSPLAAVVISRGMSCDRLLVVLVGQKIISGDKLFTLSLFGCCRA
jgi:hypothetical protein